MSFCMKIVFFVAGGSFFLCWPIASLYPKYRYLVSPFKWVLWNIPTDAEWSIQYLRREAQLKREQIFQRKVDKNWTQLALDSTNISGGSYERTLPHIHLASDESLTEDDVEDWQSACSTMSILEDGNIRSFRGISGHALGRLVVLSNGIRFVNSINKAEIWQIAFIDMVMMRKSESRVKAKLLLPLEQLEIESISGDLFRVEGMKERDNAFNTIIAFSGLRWQSLQPRSVED